VFNKLTREAKIKKNLCLDTI